MLCIYAHERALRLYGNGLQMQKVKVMMEVYECLRVLVSIVIGAVDSPLHLLVKYTNHSAVQHLPKHRGKCPGGINSVFLKGINEGIAPNFNLHDKL